MIRYKLKEINLLENQIKIEDSKFKLDMNYFPVYNSYSGEDLLTDTELTSEKKRIQFLI